MKRIGEILKEMRRRYTTDNVLQTMILQVLAVERCFYNV